METYMLEADLRTERGKGPINRLRSKGFIPGVVYGHDIKNFHLKFPTKTFKHLLEEGLTFSIPITLNVNKDNDTISLTVFMKEIQRDPVQDFPLHVDFYAVASNKKIVLPIAVVGQGIPIGLDQGGILQQISPTVMAEGLVYEIPRNVTADLTSLNVGDNLTVGQLQLPEGVRILDSPEKVLFHVLSNKKVYLE